MLTRILILVAVVVAILLLWDFIASVFMPPSARADVAKTLMEEAAEEIIEARDKGRLVVVELRGDHNDEVTKLLYDALVHRDSAAVSGEVFKIKDLDSDWPPSEFRIEQLGEDRGAFYVLLGEVDKYAQEGPNIEVEISLDLMEAEDSERFFGKTYEQRREANILESARFAVGSLPWLLRLAGWILVAALLPLGLLPLLRLGLEKESNIANALMLGGVTLTGGLLAWFAVGYGAAVLFEIAILLAAVALSGIYNYWVLDRLAE